MFIDSCESSMVVVYVIDTVESTYRKVLGHKNKPIYKNKCVWKMVLQPRESKKDLKKSIFEDTGRTSG